MGAVIALGAGSPQTLTLVFSTPVAATTYATGLSITVNSVVASPQSILPGGDPRDLVITFASDFSYNDVVVVSYSGALGNWTSNGYALRSFTVTATNASHIGNPNSLYPLSCVITEPLAPKDGVVWGIVGTDLNYIDRVLIDRYGPVSIDTGGTFGITSTNPSGVFVPQELRALNTGMDIRKPFYVPQDPADAAAAATEWQTTMVTRVGVALGALRAQDQSFSLGVRVPHQV
jgi:hypothetical protein